MSAAGALEDDGQFIPFGIYKIRSELEYEGRMETIRRFASSTDGTSISRWYSLMSQLDTWVHEDRHPASGPPNKKFRLESHVDPLLWPISPHGVQSPPPGQGVQTPPGVQGPAASSGLADPLTPPELLANKVTAAEIAKAELIARNKAAALLRREQKLVLKQNEKPLEAFEPLQYRCFW